MSSPTARTQMLLVDDNPLVLDLMRKGLEPHGEVSVCGDSADALLQCVAKPPDLLICDYRMPGLDGRQLVEKLRTRPETRGMKVIILATKPDIDEALRPLRDSVEEFIAKPFFVADLVAKTKKVLERIAALRGLTQAPAEGVVRGRLAEMNMIDLLQSLELGQKNCSLTVTRNGESCKMFFTAGNLTHAELGALAGDDAVYSAVGWPDGDFEIDFNSRTEKQTTTRSTQGLLMEALRMLDEQNRDSAG